jgi:hypothetical protein
MGRPVPQRPTACACSWRREPVRKIAVIEKLLFRPLFAHAKIPRMARRPDSEKPEIFTQKDLHELRYNLAHLSVDAVRRFYERAHADCRMIYDRLPSPKQMQTLVQVWKQLWKWR